MRFPFVPRTFFLNKLADQHDVNPDIMVSEEIKSNYFNFVFLEKVEEEKERELHKLSWCLQNRTN
jgi:hypothetical protein